MDKNWAEIHRWMFELDDENMIAILEDIDKPLLKVPMLDWQVDCEPKIHTVWYYKTAVQNLLKIQWFLPPDKGFPQYKYVTSLHLIIDLH
ncbi:hypothetical protein ROZALSC1DRAFT_31251 [Rozella allomycis CSF55]|uniref:Uncharacterized protein n=1 Tax=Rozella allomycis (strain CSF55) TaxID=988480 RepID=A0A4V1IZ56_ROZAC|nr:hypothetical protein ROZALSC1DRAFT_31251 [Rozella allomycis CSF55]